MHSASRCRTSCVLLRNCVSSTSSSIMSRVNWMITAWLWRIIVHDMAFSRWADRAVHASQYLSFEMTGDIVLDGHQLPPQTPAQTELKIMLYCLSYKLAIVLCVSVDLPRIFEGIYAWPCKTWKGDETNDVCSRHSWWNSAWSEFLFIFTTQF